MKGIFGLIVLVLILGGVAWFASPAFRGTVQKQYRERAGWTEEARKEDPVGYINFAMEELKKDVEKLKGVQNDFSRVRSKLDETLRDKQGKVQRASLILEAAKAKYNTAKEKNDFPVVVEDRKYSEQELVSQIKLWLAEKKGDDQVIAQVENALKQQEDKRNQLAVRISDSQFKVSQLESQKVILQADKLNASGQEILKNVNDVLADNDIKIKEAESPIRTIDEIAKAADKNANAKTAVMDKDVEDFLKAGK